MTTLSRKSSGLETEASVPTPGESATGKQAATPSTGAPIDDSRLVQRAKAGDMQAYRELVQRHDARVTSMVARILGERATQEDVDDTVQNIFVQAWRALPRFRGDALFSTWLYRICTNMSLREWRRIKQRRDRVVSVDDDDRTDREQVHVGLGPAEIAEQRARGLALAGAIERLPEKQRTVVLLHYYEEHTCAEIAEMIGVSIGTVWSRLHYACRALRSSVDWPGLA